MSSDRVFLWLKLSTIALGVGGWVATSFPGQGREQSRSGIFPGSVLLEPPREGQPGDSVGGVGH